MLQCDAYTGSFQSKSEAFAEAFDAWLRALDDVALSTKASKSQSGRKRPPWAQVLPQPPPAAKFTVRMSRAVQRTVKAIGQLGARPRNIT